MNAKQWFISAGVSVGIWALALGQSWIGGFNSFSGWEVVFGVPSGYEEIQAVARAFTFGLVGFGLFSLRKAFKALKEETQAKNKAADQR